MKKIRMFLLIIAAMLVVQMYEPAAICEVQAATKTTAKKNVRVNGLYKGKYNYCYYQHGRKVRNAWKTVNRKKYYFGRDGYAYRGSCDVNGIRYMFRSDRSLYTRTRSGFVTIGKYRYYLYNNGRLRTGWFRSGGYVFYANDRGIIVRNAA